MHFRSAALFGALNALLYTSVQALPTSHGSQLLAPRQDSTYWLANIDRQGSVPFSSNGTDYKVFRNVKDYGATGDGSTDDTDAINKAISEGGRCGEGCDSSTTTPALVYFPPGTYVVSAPIVSYYYSQLVGDATDLPVIKGAASFEGMALIDSDPYNDDGSNWFTNQNNFFRQIRNFVIDLTDMDQSAGAGIHWQVAQATSLQNIRFEMVKGGGSANKQQGVFMDNGSGGFMSDLTFNGGGFGAFMGSQQFTSRNLTFNDCNTAIYMNWNWGWVLKSINVNGGNVSIDMSNTPANQTVGSVMVLDSTLGSTTGVVTAFKKDGSTPEAGGALTLQNVDFSSAGTAVASNTGDEILAGGSTVSSWIQGRTYSGTTGSRSQGEMAIPSTGDNLMADGKVFERSKPMYEDVSADSFVSVLSKGAKGDGSTDDTQAIQDAMDGLSDGQILYFDHGAYVITDTVKVPSNIKITGEIWPLIMASGEKFSDESNPIPMFQIGQSGDSGAVELSDLIFETKGNAPGAILMEWNSGASSQGSNAMWDVHFRVGGSAGTELQSDKCAKDPKTTHGANADCVGSFLMFHATKSASVYVENSWFWTSDHELDLADHKQIDIYNGRGVLIESTAGTWLYGTASEHNQLYNYNLNNAQNVFMGFIQTETPYMQSNPDATVPFKVNADYADPDYAADCPSGDEGKLCRKTWGFISTGSTGVLVYGAGMYSFFENYGQDCLDPANCQTNMASVDAASDVTFIGVSTKAAVNMITYDGKSQALDADNRSNFCATLAMWSSGASNSTVSRF
jgi:glucan 1,3-beta-glucosidase